MRKLNLNELPEIIKLVGENYVFSNNELEEMKLLEEHYSIRQSVAKLVGHFLKYKLTGWLERVNKIKVLKNTITEERYILLMGEKEGKTYWKNISDKKKESGTEQKYIEKYGEIKGKKLWNDMNNRRGMSAFNVDYWMKKGLTGEEAKNKVSTLSKKGSQVGNKVQEIQREENYEEWSKKMPTTVHYWINRGYSEEESLLKVSERQTTFSKDICIEKYGEEEGLKRWERRQEKWLSTLDSKSPEEKDEINRKKLNNNPAIGNASKESLVIFMPILTALNRNNIKFNIGIDGNNEYKIWHKGNQFLYDCVIPTLKLCFEYNGERFHPNPQWKINDIEKWDNWKQLFNDNSAEEKYLSDSIKNKLIKQLRDFDVVELWSSDSIEYNQNKMTEIIYERIQNL